jgi:hypothetical protein
MFCVTAWKGGTDKRDGYGLKISIEDRNCFFKKTWQEVVLTLPNGKCAIANVNKSSFWNDTCRELISKEIGLWLLGEKLAPWPKGHPPKFILRLTGEAAFQVSQA